MCRRSVAPADKSLQGTFPTASLVCNPPVPLGLHLCAEAQTRGASTPCFSCGRVRILPDACLPAFLISLASQCSSESPFIHTKLGTGIGFSP